MCWGCPTWTGTQPRWIPFSFCVYVCFYVYVHVHVHVYVHFCFVFTFIIVYLILYVLDPLPAFLIPHLLLLPCATLLLPLLLLCATLLLPLLFVCATLLLLLLQICVTILLLLLQDIDVAYATDPAIFDDFEADLTSLLEVPDLDFSSSQDFPRATYRDSAFASTSAAAGKHLNKKERPHHWHPWHQ